MILCILHLYEEYYIYIFSLSHIYNMIFILTCKEYIDEKF